MASTKLLIEDTDQKYDASKEDILAYAHQIGIDINKEKHLMWIAEQGLAANVPAPWQILCGKEKKIYYFNPKTREISWLHPLDKEYAALVSEERSKSLNSASSDYGFESKLSSLADAPPLSSSGKNSPLPLKRRKNEGVLSNKKFEFGRIENRRGTQLAPVRLNTLKMPAAPIPKSSGVSFMPKGTTFSKNIRRVKEEVVFDNQVEEAPNYRHPPPPDDSNESLNSDEGSKYSYEETDDEEKNNQRLEPYEMLDMQLSPMHSADESPDALDINSLVQLGTKLPQRFDNIKAEHIENVNKENSPALNLRKVGQSSFLKPLSQATKKGPNKGSKPVKKVSKIKYPESEVDYEDNISVTSDEQRVVQQQIQKEWLTMQDELEKQEKEKYEVMLKDSLKKLEDEETKLRNERSEKILKLKVELQKNIDEENSAAEKSLQTLKASNKEKIIEEQEKLQKELEAVHESLKSEIKEIEEKKAMELAQKKQELEESYKKEMESLKLVNDSNRKNIEEAHSSEISNLQELHKQKIEEIESAHRKEVEEVSDSSPKKSELQDEITKLTILTKEEMVKYETLLKEKEDVLKEINSEKDNLVKLKQETDDTQAGILELQDEVEKAENDLDLLRNEKSALISELSILKENINNEKSNLLNTKNKVKSSIEAHCSKEFSEIGTNTCLTTFETVCKSVQVSVSYCDVSSQVENVVLPMSNAICQTSLSVTQNATNKSCQTDFVLYTNGKNTAEVCDDKTILNSNNVDKNLENALSGLSMKLHSRINVIEHQLRLLQENLPRPVTTHPVYSNQEYMQNQFTEVKTVPSLDNRNSPYVYSTESSVPVGLFSSSIPVSSQSKCKCELGDSSSCDVLQAVKNSVYRLNDILCSSFVPPLSGSSLYQANQPMSNYSSPFDNFYAQFRNMQEKHRLTELKHKCENEAIKLNKSSSNTADLNSFGNASHKESLKPSYHLMHSSLYSYNIPEDPLIRARSIVLKEQARTWKEQQLSNSSVPHILSLNSSSECSESSITGFATSQNVPSYQQTFLNFGMDPETDYNMWMTKLNALQLRIRSHKMI